jgi:predicted metal-dependent hydrolase
MTINFLIIICITLLIFFIKLIYEPFKSISVLSTYDQKEYKVQDTFDDPHEAANHIANLRHRIENFLEFLKDNHQDDKRVKRLIKKFNPDVIRESEDEENSTSFTINKGEEIHLCLRSKDGNRELHDLNLLTFVVIHELAHIMSLTMGHNQEFKDNFTFLLKNASQAKIYYPIDYSEEPNKYCGLTVKNNPMFN